MGRPRPRGCVRRLTTPERLRAAFARRKKLRWRAELAGAVADVADGCHSVLELRYLHDVERAHGLPEGRRQAVALRGSARRYDDVRYDAYRVVVELDGLAAHPDEARLRDRRRDNASVEQGNQVIRYGWVDVVPEPCAAAAQMARVLQAAGWRGTPRACRRPKCLARLLYSTASHVPGNVQDLQKNTNVGRDLGRLVGR